MASPQNPDGTFVPLYNDFYGTDEERIARDQARRELGEGRKRHRGDSPTTPLSDDEVRSALRDIGIDL